MLKGISLQDLAKKIEANKEMKQDYIVDTKETSLQVSEDDKVVIEVPDHGQFPLLPLAHGQIAERVKIPRPYYDRMLKETPDLLTMNVNVWWDRNPRKNMLRTLGVNGRAFLSNKYNRIENEEIAEVALPVLSDLPKVEIVSSEITDHRMYIHFVVPTIEGEVRKGDIVQVGGIISNSEVGLGAVTVAGLAWRLVCLNGMKMPEQFRKSHVGRQIDDNEDLWADDTREMDDKVILMKVRDMVRAVVDETRFRATLDTMRGLTEGKVTGNPEKAVEVLARKIGASDAERGGILRSLIEGHDLSAWGLLNAVTAQGHTARDYDRAVEFEAVGGMLLNLPTSEWKEVLQAA